MDQVNTNASFARDDLFERKRYMDMCMKLVKSHPTDRGACTIAVDAPWGVGKSTFLWMWINELTAAEKAESVEEHILTIYYNAWESDFCDSALAPLLYSLCAYVEKQREIGWLLPKDDALLKEFVSSCAGLLLMLLTFRASNDTLLAQTAGTTGQMTAKGLLGLFGRYLHKDIDVPEPSSIGEAYDKQLETREKFRDALSKLSSRFDKVIIFIDELDRCKPSFAIETLETIKHYFDVSGLTFVFGIDMTQLGHAIAGQYGDKYDAEGYFLRFFDHHVLLPLPTIEQMVSYTHQYHINDATTQKHLHDIFRACNISPREIPRIEKASNTLYQVLWDNIGHHGEEYIRDFVYLMVAMKCRLPSVYTGLINGHADWNTYHWSNTLLFYDLLSFYAPLMSDTIATCRKKLNTIFANASTLPLARNPERLIAKIGLGIINLTPLKDTMLFGQCVAHFFEQVYI